MNIAWIMVVFILLLFAAIVTWMILQNRQNLRENAERLAQRGFRPVEMPAAEIMAKIIALQPRRNENARVQRLMYKPVPEGEMYVFDLVIPSSDSDTHEENNILVVSPGLRLPRLVLFSLPRISGKLGNLLTTLFDSLINRFGGLQRIHLMNFPEFEQRFVLLGEDENATLAFFTPYRIHQLDGLEEGLTLQTNGDAYQVSFAGFRGKSKEELLDLGIGAAGKIGRMLEG